VTRWCRMLRWYGVECDESDLALRRPATAPPVPNATIMHVGAKAWQRRWAPEHLSCIVSDLERAGHRVVVTGGEGEAAPQDVGENLVGRLSLDELAALVADARLVISGDTGVAHLATAYSRPSVVLFGPISPRLWGPPRLRRHQVLWDPFTRSLDSITARDVLEAADRALTAG
jgi:ADP-heptose:LPS heptosyltransferase